MLMNNFFPLLCLSYLEVKLVDSWICLKGHFLDVGEILASSKVLELYHVLKKN